MNRIVINGRKEVAVPGGQSLFAALQGARVFLPSACGGRGACGLCKVRVLEGAPAAFTPAELKKLTEAERADHVRLACQAPVARDMRLLIPAELLAVREFRAAVTALRDLTYDIKEVRLKLLDPPAIAFRAGQHIRLRVPPPERGGPLSERSFSIASDPARQDEIELEIRLVPHGAGSTFVHRRLKVGDELTLTGPCGRFYLADTDRDILFIAGGSGMAPIKSILAEMARARNPRRTRYFFGAKSGRDLFLVEEMRALERALPDFRFIPALSEPLPGDGWSGERGLVTEVLDRLGGDCARAEAYLCGSPLMIDACIAVLKRKGVEESRIAYDRFG